MADQPERILGRALAPGVKPYRPPDLNPPHAPERGGPIDGDASRPWLAQRRGETRFQWARRVSHTCWKCGHEEKDSKALDQHEAGHDGRS